MKALLARALIPMVLAAPAAGTEPTVRQLFAQAIEAHQVIRTATFNLRAVDQLGAPEEQAVAWTGMVAVERQKEGDPMPRFAIRGAFTDHHPLGVKVQEFRRPVEPVNTAFDGRTLTVVDDLAHETRTATDPRVIAYLARKVLPFFPPWLLPRPFEPELRFIAAGDAATFTQEADAQVLGVECFALRIQVPADGAGNPLPVDSTYYFEKERKIMRRLVERRADGFVRIIEIEFLKVNPRFFPEWTFNVHPPDPFPRKELRFEDLPTAYRRLYSTP